MASIFKYPVKAGKYKYGYVVSNHPNKPKRKKGFRTKKEAEIEAKFIEDKLKLEKMHAKMATNSYTPIPFKIAFKQFIKTQKSGLDEKTQQDYMRVLNRVEQYFGDENLREITNDDYQNFISALCEQLSVSTVVKINKKIKCFVTYALKTNSLYTDFTYAVQITEKYKRSTNVATKHLPNKQFKQLVEALKLSERPIYEKTMLLLAITTGTRYGELCGICWDDINYDKRTIRIHQQLDYTKKDTFKTLKDPLKNIRTNTVTKERTLFLDDFVLDLLKELKERQPSNQKLVFFKNNEKTDVVANNTFNKWLEKECWRLQIPRITSHGLRRGFSNEMVAMGRQPLQVQYLMGHASFSTTEKYYVRLEDGLF